MTEPLYQTKTVAAATGATERQLQCWDETKVLSVPVVKHERRYRFRDALYAVLIMVLLAKHLTLKRAAQALSQLKGEYDLMRCVDSDYCIMLIGYASGDVSVVSAAGVVFVLLECDEPMIVVDLRAASVALAEKLMPELAGTIAEALR